MFVSFPDIYGDFQLSQVITAIERLDGTRITSELADLLLHEFIATPEEVAHSH